MGGKWKKAKAAAAEAAAADPEQPSTSGRKWTLAIAVPGSCLEHCSTPEAAAAVAAQLARAAAAFCADEVVVYEDSPGDGLASAGTVALARILQYLETPPWFRASLFPGSVAYPELRHAAAFCPSLMSPHHQRGQAWQQYREGVVMRSEPEAGSFVDIGADRNAHVAACVPVGRRVTLNLGPQPVTTFVPAFSESMLQAELCQPHDPVARAGMYWGFQIRLAHSLSRVLKESSHKGGYDLTVGTSRQGAVREVAELVLPRFNHVLVAFGGAEGLEEVVEDDEAVVQAGKGAADLFGLYLNCCPDQGVASIRTEDAAWMSLAYLRGSLLKYGGL